MHSDAFIALLIGASLIAFPALAASGHGGGAMQTAAANADTRFGGPGNPRNVTRVVQVTATEITFDVAELSFAKGETVKFVLRNKGKQDHELTIGDAAMQEEHREMMARTSGMSHAEMDARMGGHEMAGNSIDAKPGETKELVWQFTHAGDFEFACNYPGHAELGMFGSITVR